MAKTHLQKQTFTSKEFGLCHWEKKKGVIIEDFECQLTAGPAGKPIK